MCGSGSCGAVLRDIGQVARCRARDHRVRPRPARGHLRLGRRVLGRPAGRPLSQRSGERPGSHRQVRAVAGPGGADARLRRRADSLLRGLRIQHQPIRVARSPGPACRPTRSRRPVRPPCRRCLDAARGRSSRCRRRCEQPDPWTERRLRNAHRGRPQPLHLARHGPGVPQFCVRLRADAGRMDLVSRLSVGRGNQHLHRRMLTADLARSGTRHAGPRPGNATAGGHLHTRTRRPPPDQPITGRVAALAALRTRDQQDLVRRYSSATLPTPPTSRWARAPDWR